MLHVLVGITAKNELDLLFKMDLFLQAFHLCAAVTHVLGLNLTFGFNMLKTPTAFCL